MQQEKNGEKTFSGV
ncbi:hypothetical protein CAEBREN_24434 [Caenorhabditis brenneri]|uniref:Uncharacterized protein n=1 Tax=Caenorhabditis brenneri TaxID=135651 RepID=G0N6Q6_CAEBE|nr:hypothetical protein CAEBREN_24434 [Caenorhabditis brenneri]